MSPRAAFHRQPQVVHQATKIIQTTMAKEHIHQPQPKLSRWQQLKMDKGLIQAAFITVFSLFKKGGVRAPQKGHEEDTKALEEIVLSSQARQDINNAKFPSRKKRLRAKAQAWGIKPNLSHEKRKKAWAPIHRASMTIQQMTARNKINKILAQKVITDHDAKILDELEAQLEQGHGR